MKPTVLRLKKVDSTNNYARQLIELYGDKPELDESVVFADEQTNGRGMDGNTWISEPCKNLTFSIILKPEPYLDLSDYFMLPKLASVAVYKYLSRKKIDGNIKWPNDVLVKDRKISGILIENFIRGFRLRYSIIGIGINVNQTDFPAHLKATSLGLEKNKKYDLNVELARFLAVFFDLLSLLKSKQYSAIDRIYMENLFKLNTLAKFRSKGHLFEATIKGVDQYGRLILEDQDRHRQIYDTKEIEYIF